MINAAPTALRLAAATPSSAAAAAVAENAAGAIIGTLTTINPNAGDSFTYTVSDSRFEVVGSTLKLKAGVALNYEVARAINLTVTARDQGGLTKAQSFGLAITNVNEGPTAVKLAGARVAENATGVSIGTLSTIDPDAGNSFTYTVSDNRFEVVGATLKLKAGVALDFEAARSVALTVTSTDQGGLSKAQAFTITVTDANDVASIGGGATGAVAEDGVLTAGGTLTVADQDAGQAGFRVPTSLAGTYGNFSFDATTGAWGYALANGQALRGGQVVTDTLTVTSLDGTASQAITVTVTGANDAPVVSSGATASFAENATSTVYTATGTDVDAGTTLTWSLGGTDAGLFNIAASTGAVSFKAAPNYEAPTDSGTNNVYDLTVTASDGTLSSAAQAVAITVTNVNEAPVVSSGATASFAENATGTVYTATGTDVDAGTILTWSLGGTDAGLFNIDASTGAVSFKAAPDFEAPTDSGTNNVYDLTVTASDGALSSSARAVAITVTNVNEAPVVTSGATASFAENGTGTVYAATGTDPDAGTTLAYSLTGTDAALFAINAATGAVSFKAAPNFEAPADAGGDNVYDLTVVASDGALTASRAVTVTVSDVVENVAPTTIGLSQASVAENAAGGVIGTLAVTDPDAGDTHGYTLSDTRFEVVGDTLRLKAGVSFDYEAVTSVPLSVTATDAGGLAFTQAFAIGVTNVNEAPSVTSGATASLAENATGTVYTATGTDPDAGTTLTYTVTGTDAALFNVNATTGAVTFKTAPNFEAPADAGANNTYDVNLVVSDGTLTTSKAVAISVTNVNEAPGVTSVATASFAENGAGTAYAATATDPDAGTTLTYTVTGTDAALFNVNATTGAVSFKAAPNFEAPADAGANNTYDITVTASDGVLTASKAVAISITNVNEAPGVTSAATASVAENATGTAYAATATDPDAGTTLSYALGGTDAALFNVNAATGAVTFKAAPNFEAPADAGANNTYDITVTASDGVLTANKAVAVTVTNVAEPPALSGLATAASFAENTVNATPQLLDADVTYTGDNTLAGGHLTVIGLLAEDHVSVLNQGTGAGQIGMAGGSVTYGGVAIGTASGGVGAGFDVTFNASATAVAVDALIQALTYAGASDAPTATRDLTIRVTDAAGAATGAAAGSFTALTGTANPLNGFDVGDNAKPSFVDLNGDGRLDLVAGNFNGTFSAWQNTGSGFTALTGTANPLNGLDVGYGSAPSFVDLNGDGKLDLVSGESDGTFLVWQNTGSGFTALTGTANPFNGVNVGGNYSTPSFVDLNGDGKLDLVSGNYSGTFLVWQNTGSGFTALTDAANPLNGFDVGSRSGPCFVDLNGDGRLDLVSGESDGTFLVWQNTGSGFTALTGAANPLNGFDVGNTSAPCFVDLNGDGRLDLVSGASDGTFKAWQNVAPANTITVTVTAQNDAPSVTSATTASFAENVTGTVYTAAGTDPDAGTSLAWSLGGTDAALFDVDAATGAVSFKAVPDFEAPADAGADNSYDITVTASDGTLTASQAVAVTVTNVNEAPLLATPLADQAATGGTAFGFVVPAGSFADPDAGTTLTYAATRADGSALPAWLGFDAATGTFSGTPANADAGTLGVTVTASDGSLSASDSFALTVVHGAIATINLDTVALGTGGFKIFGEKAYDNLSTTALTTIGDLNGDGRPEILVGAANNGITGAIQVGAAYVVWGKADGTAVNLDAVALGTGGFKIYGENATDYLSQYYALTTIGDLNGDGTPEILVGAWSNEAGGNNAGAAYVVWGKADTTAVNLDTVALGTGGFKIIGENLTDYLSYNALTPIGDLNGDGRPEILVGAFQNDAGGSNAGAAYVVWGKADGTAVNLDAVALGTGGFKIYGENASDKLSNNNLTVIGDLNGDGRPEILVGAAANNNAGGTYAGAVYVVWGKADTTAVNLDTVALGTGGFKIYGENASDNLAYAGLTTIGDLNGDGKAEILVGAINNAAGGANAGAAYVVWGKADGTAVNLDTVALGTGGFKIFGEAAGDKLSENALATIGDLNGDGRPEILVGAHNNAAGGSNAGAAYVVWGKADGAAVDLDAVALGTGGFKIYGEKASDELSITALTSIGDLNGDGRPEILVGAFNNDAGGSNAGAAYVVWGKADGAAVNLDTVALGTGGFRIIGENATDNLANAALTTIGDLNGDGRPEILVGAWQNAAGGTDAGAAYIVYSQADWLGGI